MRTGVSGPRTCNQLPCSNQNRRLHQHVSTKSVVELSFVQPMTMLLHPTVAKCVRMTAGGDDRRTCHKNLATDRGIESARHLGVIPRNSNRIYAVMMQP